MHTNKLSSNSLKIILLKFFSVTIIATLLYIVAKPKQNSFADFDNFSKWKSIDTSHMKLQDKLIDAKRYQEKNNHNLRIEIFAVPSFTWGALGLLNFYFNFDLNPQELNILEDKNIGSYGLFTQDNSTYLATCIHSQGKTAVTKEGFAKLANQNISSRIFPWILGLADLRDWRCFWVNMSVSLEELNQEQAIKILKEKLYTIVSETEFQ